MTAKPIMLKQSYRWADQTPRTIGDAVREQCDPVLYDDPLDDLKTRVVNAIDVLSRMVETLHQKGLLTTEEVIHLLEDTWEEVECES